MRAQSFHAMVAEAGSEALWRSNPVLCIDELVRKWKVSDRGWAECDGRLENLIARLGEHGIGLPAGAINRWTARSQMRALCEPPEPRVVGLAIEGSPATGYVFPLRPTRVDDHWSVDGQLPFNHEDILDVLTGLLEASGIAEKWSVPERFAFGSITRPVGGSVVSR